MSKKICDICNKQNEEFVIYKKKFLGIFNIKISVCQSCISKAFRKFSTDK